MKRLSITILICLLGVTVYSQPVNNAFSGKNQGFFYQLTAWKYAVEEALTSGLAASSTKADSTAVLKRYGRLVRLNNAAINQFMFELNRKRNLVKKFNQINDAYKSGQPTGRLTNETMNEFSEEISYYVKQANEFVRNPGGRVVVAGAIADFDITAILDQAWTIYKDIKDLQALKGGWPY